MDAISEYKTSKPQDSETVRYLVAIYNNMGRYSEATQTLEFALEMFHGNKDLSEALFFSYVREAKLLKQ